MKNLCRRVINYANRVYNIGENLRKVEDGRIDPSIPKESVFFSLFLGFVTRVPSFNELESRNRDEFSNILLKPPSADTLGYTLSRLNIEQLREVLVKTNNHARRNKVFRGGTIDGYNVCALDGTRLYSTKVPQDESLWRKTQKDDGSIIWHVDMVFLSFVGDCPPLMFGMEPIYPGEGETTAAERLIKNAYRDYYRYCDIFTVDALYAKAPFINAVIDENKDVVVRVKQENYHIIKDIEGLVANEEPDQIIRNINPKRDKDSYSRYLYDLKIWDRDGFTSWEGVDKPLRCLKIVETKKQIVRGRVVNEETKTIYLVTTCDKSIVSSLTVWSIAHRRWDIENSGFHNLKTNYNLDHCYTHEPKAIIALILVMMIAFNLFMLFFSRNLGGRYKRETKQAIARKILTHAGKLKEIALIPI